MCFVEEEIKFLKLFYILGTVATFALEVSFNATGSHGSYHFTVFPLAKYTYPGSRARNAISLVFPVSPVFCFQLCFTQFLTVFRQRSFLSFSSPALSLPAAAGPGDGGRLRLGEMAGQPGGLSPMVLCDS